MKDKEQGGHVGVPNNRKFNPFGETPTSTDRGEGSQ